jgi:hypothetical protein
MTPHEGVDMQRFHATQDVRGSQKAAKGNCTSTQLFNIANSRGENGR